MNPDHRGITMNHTLPLLTALLLAPLAASHVAEPASKPNILFIIADDLGWGDLRCYGNPVIDTPTLDGLAKAGVRFTDHYSPSALCAPARAGFLTGRYNHRTGAVDVPSNRGLDRLDLSEKTFGDYFRHARYETALIGKWHNGAYSQDYLPHRRGFDLFFGFPNGGQDYWKWNLLRNDAAVPHDGRYLTDALNDEAITFIREHAAKPFALWLAHHAPHGPLQAPEALVQKYEKRLGKDATKAVAVTYAMIEAMDTGLARVFQSLKDEGLWEKTIIVFTSDNGPVLRRDAELGSQKRFNGVFSGEKESILEGGIRVPGIVAWPGHIPGGRVESTPVHGCDWLPTLYSLENLHPQWPGVSCRSNATATRQCGTSTRASARAAGSCIGPAMRHRSERTAAATIPRSSGASYALIGKCRSTGNSTRPPPRCNRRRASTISRPTPPSSTTSHPSILRL